LMLLSVCLSIDVNFKQALVALVISLSAFQWTYLFRIGNEISTILGIKIFVTKQE
jgi:hypothetical protein